MARKGLDVVDDLLLHEVSEVVNYRKLVDKMLVKRVVSARKAGATWQELGDALGVTHQAARKRFKALSENGRLSLH
jgi:predicted transcriptional regulator